MSFLNILLMAASLLAAPPEDTSMIHPGGLSPVFSLPAIDQGQAMKLVHKTNVALNDLVGVLPMNPSRGVLLYFFQREAGGTMLKALKKVSRKYRKSKLHVLAICTDSDQDDDLHSWLKSLHLGYPVLRDNYRIVAQRYGLQSMPFLVIVDSKGLVFSLGVPPSSRSKMLHEVDSQIQALLSSQ